MKNQCAVSSVQLLRACHLMAKPFSIKDMAFKVREVLDQSENYRKKVAGIAMIEISFMGRVGVGDLAL